MLAEEGGASGSGDMPGHAIGGMGAAPEPWVIGGGHSGVPGLSLDDDNEENFFNDLPKNDED